MKTRRSLVVFWFGLMMILSGDVRAYEAVGLFLDFPPGALDAVTRMDVHITPDPFKIVAENRNFDDYPPAYQTDLQYLNGVFPDYTGLDFQGALGIDWIRLPYSGGMQSYQGTDTLLSRDPSGTPVIVDGYVFDRFPNISGVSLIGYVGGVQTTLNFMDTMTVEVPVGFLYTRVKVNLWQLIVAPDTTPPVIYLSDEPADDTLAWTVDLPYQDLGVLAEDNVDGEMVYDDLVILVDGVAGDPATLINTSVPIGTTYSITYSAMDASGNISDLRTRTVEIVPNQPPVIYLNGQAADDEVNVVRGRVYSDMGVTAADDVEGDISSDMIIYIDGVEGDPSHIDTAVSGVAYVLTYHVTDDLDQAAEVRQRTVHVVEPAAASGGGGGCFLSTLRW